MLANTRSNASIAAVSCFTSPVRVLYRNVVAARRAVDAESANEFG
jgi:hypothetical protein